MWRTSIFYRVAKVFDKNLMRRNISFRDAIAVFRHKADSEFIEYLMVAHWRWTCRRSFLSSFPPLLFSLFSLLLSARTSLKYARRKTSTTLRYKSSRRSWPLDICGSRYISDAAHYSPWGTTMRKGEKIDSREHRQPPSPSLLSSSSSSSRWRTFVSSRGR